MFNNKIFIREPKDFEKYNFVIYCSYFQLTVVIKIIIILLFDSNEYYLSILNIHYYNFNN